MSESGVNRIYPRLRRRAQTRMRGERRGHALQATAVVHEAWVRAEHAGALPTGDDELFGLIDHYMRLVLVDDARQRRRLKRSGRHTRVPISAVDCGADGDATNAADVTDAGAALAALGVENPEAHRAINLRMERDLTNHGIAAELGVSVSTAKRLLAAAIANLTTRLRPKGA